jgi:hypothetical protein
LQPFLGWIAGFHQPDHVGVRLVGVLGDNVHPAPTGDVQASTPSSIAQADETLGGNATAHNERRDLRHAMAGRWRGRRNIVATSKSSAITGSGTK